MRPEETFSSSEGSATAGSTRRFSGVGGPSPQNRRTPPAGRPTGIDAVLALVRVDRASLRRQTPVQTRPVPPGPVRVALASVAAVVGSLVADAVLVAIGMAVFPSTKGYVHFRFPDYGKLTLIGVVIACVAWPVVTRISFDPRWLFLRLAVVVTLVLWLPDLWILSQGQPGRAVAVLMVMHLAIALVTYNALVRLAPAQPPSGLA
jgi:hypothetical protein